MIPIYEGADAWNWLNNKRGKTQFAPDNDSSKVNRSVAEIIETVRAGGDSALRSLAQKFGDPAPADFKLSQQSIDEAIARVSELNREVLKRAAERVRTFGSEIKNRFQPGIVDCGEYRTGFEFAPVERVACYVPGGIYPLPSTAIMTAVTAQVAGVKDIFIVSPALTDAVIFAGTLAGVTEFYNIGGAQAVAAFAFGTESIRRADMFVGPGNAYVTEAKRQLQGIIGIDMLAGPSEIAVIADETSDPAWLATDLVSQAEHSPDARAYLITVAKELEEPASRRRSQEANVGCSRGLAERTAEEVARIRSALELPDFIDESLQSSAILVFSTIEECARAADIIAPEHLHLQVGDPWALKEKVSNYGSLFLGGNATVPYGDYMAGPNHTLPTNGSARFSGALTPATFLRPRTWIEVATPSRSLSLDTIAFANLEGLFAHAEAARVRLKPITAYTQ